MIKSNLLKLIEHYKNYPFNYNIYVQENCEVDKNMECLLVDDDEVKDNIILFEGVIFKYLVNIDIIYSVVDNLNQQKQDPFDEDYISAFKYYIENDAFIDLEHNHNP